MTVKNEVMALIPARGGSKTIPRKNILPFVGNPLISYSIAAGLKSEFVNRVLVSTDDQEIAAVAEDYGADVPFLRPKEYAQDCTPDFPVFKHALDWLAEHENYHPQIVVQLRPTSPVRKVHHIDQAVLRLLKHPEADAVRTVCKPFQNPYKMWRISPEGYLEPLLASEFDEPYNMPRQALPEVYWQTGYVDAAWSDTILTKNSMTGDRILPLVVEPEDLVDIDTLADWTRAEEMLLTGEISWDDLGFYPEVIDQKG
jgi:N-acylneuraminate cytidylyltransferase